MRSNSPRQIELDLSSIAAADAEGSGPVGIESSKNAGQSDSNVRSTGSQFGADSLERNISSQAYAITAKMAGRMNAAAVSEDEYQRLLQERAHLLNKKFSEGLTRRDEVRLKYVRWNLDRIDDARHGRGLDVLEDLVTQYETILARIQGLERELEQARPHPAKRVRG